MKYRVIFILTFFALLICKQEKRDKVQYDNYIIQNETEDYFSLSINSVVEYDDQFILHYLEEVQKIITSENAVTVQILFSDAQQELSFKIKEEFLPTIIFLSFGNN